MNDTIKTILKRRSIRKFLDTKIKKEDLELIVSCALHAPSARGSDLWHFTIINDQTLIDELIAIMKKALDNPNYTMYSPKAIIIPSTPEDYRFGRDDNACALENIFLAATSLGIGSVWINQLLDLNQNADIRAFYDKLMIPKEHVVYGIAALGYPDGEVAKKERKGTYTYIEG